MWMGKKYLEYISAASRFLYLVTDSFAHEDGGNMEWQDILEEKFVDVLHGLHLLSFHLETFVQQEIYAATKLILRESKRF